MTATLRLVQACDGFFRYHDPVTAETYRRLHPHHDLMRVAHCAACDGYHVRRWR